MATQKIYSAEEAQERFRSLPSEVQLYLYGPDMMKAIEEVGMRNHLHIDQIGSLETEVVGVILGFTEPQDFPDMLSDALSIDRDPAQAIAKDIDGALLQHVRALMQQTSAPAGPVEVSMSPAASMAPAPAAVVQAAPVAAMELMPTVPVASPAAVQAAAELTPADIALAQPTVSTVQTVSVNPQTVSPSQKPIVHAADPYREPIE